MKTIISLHKPSCPISGNIQLSGSKSISNRVLIIKALSKLNFEINNISESDDTKHLQKALELIENKSTEIKTIDVGHAGTDMRFLTALLSITNGEYILTGSERLQQRPIAPLVEALQKLGAEIHYQNQIGFPPLKIKGKDLIGGKLSIASNISSQFVSALLLIAPYLKNGLELQLIGEAVSSPYINMTIETMEQFGAPVFWKESNAILVKKSPYFFNEKDFYIESDWSSASYYYSLVSMSPIGTSINLTYLTESFTQTDRACVIIYKHFGVETAFNNGQISITKTKSHQLAELQLDFLNFPDIAQTVACTCLGLDVSFLFTGLQTLKIKETNRIEALKKEFLKFNQTLIITENSIQYVFNQNKEIALKPIIIDTYHDHRMAMAFAPLCLVYNEIQINDADVVSKSYPTFWRDLESVGINILNKTL